MAWDETIKKSFKFVGTNVFIGNYCVFTNPAEVVLHDNVRIDPGCVISTQLEIGSYSHICAHAILSGGAQHKIWLTHGCFIGYGSKLFCASEDYSGIGGVVGDFWFENKIERGDIKFNDHSGVASDVIVFPGIELPEGCCIGAKSMVMSKQHLTEWSVWFGVPLKFQRTRFKSVIKVKDKWTNAH